MNLDPIELDSRFGAAIPAYIGPASIGLFGATLSSAPIPLCRQLFSAAENPAKTFPVLVLGVS